MVDDTPERQDPCADESCVLEVQARLAVEAAGLGTWIWDVAADRFTINRRFAEVLGRPGLEATAFTASTIAEMTHPDDREMVASELAKVLERTEHVFDTEHRGVTPDGQVVWLRARAAVVERDGDGAPASVAGVVEDRTDAKAGELAREAEARRTGLVLEASRAGVWDWDVESGEIYWSPRLREMLGVSPDTQIRFDELQRYTHPEDQPKFEAELNAHLSHGAPYAFDMRMIKRSGETITVRVRGKAEVNAQGAPIRMVGSLVDVTRAKETELAVLEADARASLALASAGLVLLEHDLETNLVEVGPALGDLLHRPELVGRAVDVMELWSHIHPDDYARVTTRFGELLNGSIATTRADVRIVRADGAERWVSINTARPRAPVGEASSRLISVLQDLTERKQVELDLADGKHRFERAAEGSFIAVCDWELETGALHWSRQFNELLRLGEEERITSVSQMASFIHPDDIERLRVAQHRHLEHGEGYAVEHRMIRKDGAVIRVQARGVVDRDEHGVAVRFIGSLMDVTAEREAQEAARHAGARAQFALEAANLCVWEFDVGAQMVTMDQALADLLGRPEFANQPLTDDQVFAFTAPEDLEEVRALLAQVTRGEQPVVRSEHRVVHKDGRQIWILAHVGAAERDASGRPKRIIGITQDLSRQKAVEQALRDAKERAVAANEAKSAFLATMSHEIRTPLNGVLGMAQLLTLGQLDDKQRRYAQTILSSGRSLSAIIDDVLDISRIEAGKMNLSPVRADIADIVHAALEPSQAVAADKGLTLSIDLDAAVGEARCVDATRMSQVLANLISNAVKFTETGGVRVRASVPAPGRVRFEVEDDGPGVSRAMQARIFERFTQADMSTRRAHGGAGLGLAIAKELTELAGGEIGVISHDGQGALFWFEIPAPIAPGQAGKDQAGARRQAVEGARVLVVEDHAVNRTTTAALLESVGLIAREADSAAEGLHVLRTEPVDAVLLDMHMPGDGGDVVLKAIREGSAGRTTLPVFFVTADVTVDARQSAQALGADGFFSKPLEFHAIHAALNDALSGRKTGA